MEIWHCWVIAAIVLFIAELIIPGFLVACFGVGCLTSALFAGLDFGGRWQLAGFSAGTLLVYFTIRPFVIRHLYKTSVLVKTNVNALVGKVGVVTQTLDPHNRTGRVKVRGEDWRGVPLDDVVIEAGERVEVVKVAGTKLLVKIATTRKEA